MDWLSVAFLSRYSIFSLLFSIRKKESLSTGSRDRKVSRWSIFKESWELCISNDEEDKYLMTFQTLLSRIPKWNNSIIEAETKRIVEKSKCTYLEDLISCVHISHLKILTSIISLYKNQ